MPKVKTKFGQENKLIHPKSRKADQMSREWHRDVRVKSKKKEAATKMTMLGEKVAWFRDNLEPSVTVCTPAVTASLIEQYLGRFDEELEQIKLKNQVGQRTSRQHASREDTIEHINKLEKEEYEGCGFEIPDIMCEKNLEYLKSWNGELRFLQNINLKRFRKKELYKSTDSGTKTEEEQEIDKAMDTV